MLGVAAAGVVSTFVVPCILFAVDAVEMATKILAVVNVLAMVSIFGMANLLVVL